MKGGELLAALCRVAREVPTAVVERLCQRLEGLGEEATVEERERVLGTVMQPGARAELSRLWGTWAREVPGLSPETLAWALRAAEAADRSARAEQRLELAWSGPLPGLGRRIDQALLQVIDGAREEILLVTFAAYRVPVLREALLRAGRRKVRLCVIAESERESDGRIRGEVQESLGPELAAQAAVYVWPLEARPRGAEGAMGVLHAKCAVADRRVLLVSSANLTGAALSLNMELGVLVEGGELPGQAARHFDALMASGVLVQVG